MRIPEGKSFLRIIRQLFLWSPHVFIHKHAEAPTYMNKHAETATYMNKHAETPTYRSTNKHTPIQKIIHLPPYLPTKSKIIIRKKVKAKY